jgi:hypothetical protein
MELKILAHRISRYGSYIHKDAVAVRRKINRSSPNGKQKIVPNEINRGNFGMRVSGVDCCYSVPGPDVGF